MQTSHLSSNISIALKQILIFKTSSIVEQNSDKYKKSHPFHFNQNNVPYAGKEKRYLIGLLVEGPSNIKIMPV